jgi:hypothetical protein
MLRQHVQAETVQELERLEPHDLAPVAVGVIPVAKAHCVWTSGDEPLMRDRHAVG